jgi:hypothetical protein
MKRNIGTIDRILRIVLALAGVMVVFVADLKLVYNIIILLSSGVLLTTALIGFCPVCSLSGFSSCKVSRK